MQTIVKNTSLDLKGSAINFMFAYAEQDLDKMMRFCDTEGEVWFKPLGEDGRGTIGGLGKGLWTALMDSFPDLNNTVDSATLDADGNVRCQVVIRGTQAKDFAGIPCKDQQFNSDHIFIFKHNSDGKINSIHIEWNHADFQRQLGS
jgi:steroid delta-isomerase-like uncharacterized protein